MPATASVLNNLWQSAIQELGRSRRLLLQTAHPPLKVGGLLISGLLASVCLASCRGRPVSPPRHIKIEQTWEIVSGDWIQGFLVAASLGDISVQLNGAAIHAPFHGEVELSAMGESCILFSSPEVPAYLFRYCGVTHPQVGLIQPGEAMGRARFLHFATLRRQPEGTWVIVEPSTHVLEKSLRHSLGRL